MISAAAPPLVAGVPEAAELRADRSAAYCSKTAVQRAT